MAVSWSATCDGEFLFEVDAVGQVLVVEARGVGGLLDVEAVVDGADDVVGDGGDDGGAAGGAHDEGELAGFVPVCWGGDDGWSHGGERALAGGDGVGGALDEAVHVGDADLGGEVVHLVVHEEAEAFDGDSGAEAAVEGVGAGDGVAVGVDDGEVGGLGGFFDWRGLRGRGHEAGGADEVVAEAWVWWGRWRLRQAAAYFGFAICLSGRVLKSGSPR